MIHLEGDDPFADVSETVARFCLAAGIPRHDLRPAFRGRRTESLWVHPVDMHPNERAHRLPAESLAPAIRALSPLRCTYNPRPREAGMESAVRGPHGRRFFFRR